MIKNFIILILFIVCLALIYFIVRGDFCHIDYIKPLQTLPTPTFLGVI